MKLGNWNLGPRVFDWLYENLEPGKTIVELGSGAGSAVLAETWSVYSVEHDPKWFGRYPGPVYILAPIRLGWYDVRALQAWLPKEYDLLIVDGPPGSIGRWGVVEYFDVLFRSDVPVLVDDVNRREDRLIFEELAQGRESEVFKADRTREFGVIL